jgi:hypothetical protein
MRNKISSFVLSMFDGSNYFHSSASKLYPMCNYGIGCRKVSLEALVKSLLTLHITLPLVSNDGCRIFFLLPDNHVNWKVLGLILRRVIIEL